MAAGPWLGPLPMSAETQEAEGLMSVQREARGGGARQPGKRPRGLQRPGSLSPVTLPARFLGFGLRAARLACPLPLNLGD